MPEMLKCFVKRRVGKVGVIEQPVPILGPTEAVTDTPNLNRDCEERFVRPAP